MTEKVLGKLLSLGLEDNYICIALQHSGKTVDVRINRKVAVRMIRSLLEEIADEEVKRSRWWRAWASPCSCGSRSPGNVNLTMFLCPCPLVEDILENMYNQGRGARKSIDGKLLYKHLIQKSYSQEDIDKHLRGLYRRVGAIVPTKKGYVMTEFGLAIWRNWRRKFRKCRI
jgi:hypothetical protein